MVFDLKQGGLLTQRRVQKEEQAEGKAEESWDDLEVVETRRVGEVWVPTQIRIAAWSPNRPHQVTVHKITIDDIQLGKLTKADLEVDFPPKTKVRNEFTGNQFTIGPDGQQVQSQDFLRGQEELKEFTGPIEEMLGKTTPELPHDGWLAGERPDLKGKPYLIHFWATWCGPCKNDIPRLKRLAGDGAQVIGLHPAGTPKDEVRQAVEDHGLNYPVLLISDDGGQEKAASRGSGRRKVLWKASDIGGQQKLAGYPSGVLPYCILVDSGGRVADHGFLGQELIAKFNTLRRAGEKE